MLFVLHSIRIEYISNFAAASIRTGCHETGLKACQLKFELQRAAKRRTSIFCGKCLTLMHGKTKSGLHGARIWQCDRERRSLLWKQFDLYEETR